MSCTLREKGFALAFIGAILISPDALLMRIIDLPPTTTLAWRAVFSAFAFFAYLAATRRMHTLVPTRARAMVGACYCAGTASFVYGVHFTTIAHVLLIFAITPMAAAFWSYAFWGKRIARYTLWCASVAIVGAMVVILAGHDATSPGVSSAIMRAPNMGDIIAIGGMLATGLGFAVVNAKPSEHFQGAQCAALLGLAAILMVFVPTVRTVPDSEALTLLALLGVLVAAAFLLFYLAARYISSTETALFLLIETVLAPLLVWWALGEVPTTTALWGGAVIIAALAANSLIALGRR